MGDMLIRDIPEGLKQDIEQAAKKAGRSLSATAIDLLQHAVEGEKTEPPIAEAGSNWDRIRAIISPDGYFDDEFAKFMDEVEAERKRDFGRPVDFSE